MDPMTKIGIRICIQKMAKDAGAGTDPQNALDWALTNGILAVNQHQQPGEVDDLILTAAGQEAIARFYGRHRQNRPAGIVLPKGVRRS